MTLGAGAVFAGYTIVRMLGSGGMGEVYLAQHPRLPRTEALKLLKPEISTDETFRARFIREADSIAALDHPHIVTVYDRGDADGTLWIATQYIDGTDAAQLMKDRYPAGMPVEDALAITTAIAEALDYAHDRGLVHRDVKPANILLSQRNHEGDRRIFLADFGIARTLDDSAGLTATNFTVGTFAYAAPEQLMGEALDGRADQYALAATMYHLLTGAAPICPRWIRYWPKPWPRTRRTATRVAPISLAPSPRATSLPRWGQPRSALRCRPRPRRRRSPPGAISGHTPNRRCQRRISGCPRRCGWPPQPSGWP